MTDSSDIAARAREALTDPDNLDLALNPEPLVRSLLAALETAETKLRAVEETLPTEYEAHGIKAVPVEYLVRALGGVS